MAKNINPELVAAVKAKAQGKATEAQKDLMLANTWLLAKARKEAGLQVAKSRSHVAVTANGTNGFSHGWRESYALDALADLLQGSITIVVTPVGKPDAKPVSAAKIQELMAELKKVNAGELDETPRETAARVAGK